MPLRIVSISGNEVVIYAKQGERWELTLQVKNANGDPLDLTNYLIIAQAKKTYADSSPVFSFNCEKIDAINGILKLYILPNMTSQIQASPRSTDELRLSDIRIGQPGVYVFDVKIYNSDDAMRILEGKIVVDPEVSKI